MWLSWVRKLHTADGTLRLSKALFHAIETWGGDCTGVESSFGSDRRGGWGEGPWVVESAGCATEVAAKDECGLYASSGSGTSDHTPAKAAVGAAADAGTAIESVARNNREPRYQTDAIGEQDKISLMNRGERVEWEQVAELAKTLVKDFGRFPCADDECSGVRTELLTDDERNTRNEKAGSGQKTTSELSAVYIRLNDRPVSNGSSEDQQGEAIVSGEEVDSGFSLAVQKAEELKARGNEAFRAGNLDAARVAYSAALGVLSEVADTHAAHAAGLAGTIAGSGEVEVGDGNEKKRKREEYSTLRGVLHRNRAAVLLRLFDRVVETLEKTCTGRKSSTVGRESREAAIELENAVKRAVDDDYTDHKSVAAGGVAGSDATETAGRKEKTNEEVGVGSPSSPASLLLPLLAQCETDCLGAIEVDPTDKKAMFRLAKCRDLRRQERCRRLRGTARNSTMAGTGIDYCGQVAGSDDRFACPDFIATFLLSS